jgi:hypothetical protein
MTSKAKPSQLSKFKQARELETDNSEKRFNEKLGKIARQKPGRSAKEVQKAKELDEV